MIGRLFLYVFFRYHHFVNSFKLFHRLTLCMWHRFSFRYFGVSPPDLCVSILVFVSYSSIPQSPTSPELSPSFVALVKSSLAPFFFPSLVLSPCLAAVPACVLCVCFAYVSMSNGSYTPLAEAHQPFVVRRLTVPPPSQASFLGQS